VRRAEERARGYDDGGSAGLDRGSQGSDRREEVSARGCAVPEGGGAEEGRGVGCRASSSSAASPAAARTARERGTGLTSISTTPTRRPAGTPARTRAGRSGRSERRSSGCRRAPRRRARAPRTRRPRTGTGACRLGRCPAPRYEWDRLRLPRRGDPVRPTGNPLAWRPYGGVHDGSQQPKTTLHGPCRALLCGTRRARVPVRTVRQETAHQ
jgi:hypothetical protein